MSMLRDIIPQIINIKDSKEDPNIYNILVDTLENEYETIKEYIDDLGSLTDSDLEYIKTSLGRTSLTFIKDWVKSNLVYLHKIKGTPHSWDRYFTYLDTGIEAVELNKDNVFEREDWGEGYSLYSNRVSFSCETVEETLSASAQESYFESIQDITPAHTVLYKDGIESEVSDDVSSIEEFIGCSGTCETVQEDIEENSDISGYLDDTIGSVEETFNLEAECISDCETSCVGCCETSCECDTCELFCETGCEVYQTHNSGGGGGGSCQSQSETLCTGMCEVFCEWPCQVATYNYTSTCKDDLQTCDHVCESGSCEGCYCEICGCMSECQIGCEEFCEAECTSVCMMTCTTTCECNCEDSCVGTEENDHSCNFWCMSDVELACCESYCEGSCVDASCTVDCQWSCQSACTTALCECNLMFCDDSCEGGCQNGAEGCYTFNECDKFPDE